MWLADSNENGQDGNDDFVWRSKREKREDSGIDVSAAHRALFERVESNISAGFASAQRALVDLQLQLQIKVRQLREQQETILRKQSPSGDAITEFEENIKKMDRSLESFTAHADNLSHIKLTLARAAAFVSPEGSLAQIVSVVPVARFNPTITAPTMSTGTFGTQERGLERSLDRGTNRSIGNFRDATPVISTFEQDFGRKVSLGWDITSQSGDHRPAGYLTWTQQTSERLANSARRISPERQSAVERLHNASSSNRIPNSTCFVFYLPPGATNETLRSLFMRYGTVLNAYVAMDKVTNKTRGFGFVDFSTPTEAQAAVAGLDKYALEGKFLSVSIKV